jgi:hypothetical protein
MQLLLDLRPLLLHRSHEPSVLMEGKQISLPQLIITYEIRVDLEKRVNSLKWT